MKPYILSASLLVLPAPLVAQELSATDAYVRSNLISILYHELGHAIIDLMRLPVFGQEEDAADVASILLIDQLYEEEDAVNITYDSAHGFLAEADATGDEVAYWDTHGSDLQRYYTLVCLFSGANMEEREDVAVDLGVPDERLDTCEEEFELAYDSWNPVFDELSAAGPGQSLEYVGGNATLTEQLISEEVAALNMDFQMPVPVIVSVEPCGEANAFYDPAGPQIIICSEFEDWLRKGAP